MSNEQHPLADSVSPGLPGEAGIHAWSLLDGTYAWCAATQDALVTGTAEGHNAGEFAIAISAEARLLISPDAFVACYDKSEVPERIRVAFRRDYGAEPARWAAARTLAKTARAHLRATFTGYLTGLRCWSRIDVGSPPGESTDLHVVATDAAVRSDRQAWAYVTAGGWADCGAIVNPDVNVAELAAQVAGLRVMPNDADVTVITDSVTAARAWALVQANRQPSWVPRSLRVGMVEHVRRLGRITVEHHPRNTHPLQAAAHHLAGAANNGQASPDRRLPMALYRSYPWPRTRSAARRPGQGI
jgi:hypothetical protein